MGGQIQLYIDKITNRPIVFQQIDNTENHMIWQPNELSLIVVNARTNNWSFSKRDSQSKF